MKKILFLLVMSVVLLTGCENKNIPFVCITLAEDFSLPEKGVYVHAGEEVHVFDESAEKDHPQFVAGTPFQVFGMSDMGEKKFSVSSRHKESIIAFKSKCGSRKEFREILKVICPRRLGARYAFWISIILAVIILIIIGIKGDENDMEVGMSLATIPGTLYMLIYSDYSLWWFADHSWWLIPFLYILCIAMMPYVMLNDRPKDKPVGPYVLGTCAVIIYTLVFLVLCYHQADYVFKSVLVLMFIEFGGLGGALSGFSSSGSSSSSSSSSSADDGNTITTSSGKVVHGTYEDKDTFNGGGKTYKRTGWGANDWE